MRIETQEQLEELCKKWQAVLRLQDWDVECVLANHPEDMSESALGDIEVCIPLKRAHIRVLHPDITPKGWDGKISEEQERVLVHELIHIHFATFEPKDRESLEYSLWEQAVEILARIMVDLV